MNNFLSFDINFTKSLISFKEYCKLKLKEATKNIIEKIEQKIEKTRINFNNISSLLISIKEKVKTIQENIANESIIPLQKKSWWIYQKMVKMDEIREKIYIINSQFIK